MIIENYVNNWQLMSFDVYAASAVAIPQPNSIALKALACLGYIFRYIVIIAFKESQNIICVRFRSCKPYSCLNIFGVDQMIMLGPRMPFLPFRRETPGLVDIQLPEPGFKFPINNFCDRIVII